VGSFSWTGKSVGANHRVGVSVTIDEFINKQISQFEHKPAHPDVIIGKYINSFPVLDEPGKDANQFHFV